MLYVLVDDILKAKFFLGFSACNEITFITNKFSCYIFLKFKTNKKIVLLLNKRGASFNIKVDDSALRNTISVLNGRQSLKDAYENYKQITHSLENKMFSSIYESDTLIVFNGNHPTAIATTNFFKKFNAKILYAEISNLPGKMIFDPKGVNAQSILFERPEILDSLPAISEDLHRSWIEGYIHYKFNPLPQSKISIKNYSVIAFDDLLSRLMPFFIREDSLNFSKKVKMFLDKYKSKKMLMSSNHADLNIDYIFYPSQVTSDTQLRINSDIDNISAINKIISEEKHKVIYVKIHPAESDITTINYFMQLSAKGKIVLVNNNTIELIKNASCVYTINSTVGLETLIFDKKLIVLGRAIYSNFNSLRLRQYIHNYLIDLDYFNENTLTSNHIDKLKKLTEI